MVLPVIMFIAVAAAIGVGAAAYLGWDAIKNALSGKRLAVLGDRAVGKTHLVSFLSKGEIPEHYQSTGTTTTAAGRRVSLKELAFELKSMEDVGGGTEFLSEWKRIFEKSDYVLYLFRVDKMIAGDKRVRDRVLHDLKILAQWCGESAKPLVLVGTHADQDADWRQEDPLAYEYRVRSAPFCEKMLATVGGPGRVSLVIGSMKTRDGTERLVYMLLQTLGSTERS